jgi:hypothetical protein
MEESSTAVDRWKNEWARQQNGKVVGTDSRKVRKGHRRANRKREASFTLMGATMQDILDREMKTSPKPEHQEGPVARAIEQQTAKLPSDIFLWAAVGSISASLVESMQSCGKLLGRPHSRPQRHLGRCVSPLASRLPPGYRARPCCMSFPQLCMLSRPPFSSYVIITTMLFHCGLFCRCPITSAM